MGSAVLLGVSSHLNQNRSYAPLLWVLPLALYLVTFIISFDHPRWYRRSIFFPLGAIALPAMAWLADSLDLALAAPVYSLGLFVTCEDLGPQKLPLLYFRSGHLLETM